jgi:ATP-dependent DNA helicase
MYHGTPQDRAELRRTVMALPVKHEVEKPLPKKRGRKPGAKASTRSKRKSSAKTAAGFKEDSGAEAEEDAKADNVEEDPMASFPVVITTYEMIIKDRTHLANYHWGYIVVDEGHRLKNLNCKLIKEIKKYTSAGRMLLTGTPLHVRSCLHPQCLMADILFTLE